MDRLSRPTPYTRSALAVILLLLVHTFSQAQEYPQAPEVLSGPYLGQTPPGQTAQLFAPGIVSTPLYELFSAFTPQMDEFYFVRYDEQDKPSMICYTYQEGRWQAKVTGPRVGEPFIAPDGKTMHLGRRYMERTEAGWSAVKNLGAPFSDFRIMRLVTSANGTYYFDEANGKTGIRYSRQINGQRETPKVLDIDFGIYAAHPFIAPDESYIIWDDQRESGFGRADLYISFRQPDGSWGPAINMGEGVNTERSDSYATITPDGKYLLFNRNVHDDNTDIYWVDASIIETLRPAYAQGSLAGSAPEATATEDTASFWDIPHLAEAYVSTAPEDRNDGVSVGELAMASEHKTMLLALAEALEDATYGGYDALLIAQHGQLVFESYYRKGRVNLPHPQASATKGYTTLAVGRAIQLGYLTMEDLHKPLVSFLKDLDPTKWAAGAEHITLHKAMTMRSGLRIAEETREALEEDPSQVQGQALLQAWLEHTEPITPEAQTFNYSFDPDLVMQVIEAVVPGTAQDFIKQELLDKMGITQYSWKNDVSGLPEAGWRVSMTARDMLKWGTLVLNKGQWNGEQLLPEAFVDKATAALTKPANDWIPEAYSYGYYWYHTAIPVDDAHYTASFAWGGGDQYIMVVNELDLVLAITGHDNEGTLMTQVAKVIVPAFTKGAPPILVGAYLGQEPPAPGAKALAFAPGIVNTDAWGDAGGFSPDMQVFNVNRWRMDNGKRETELVTFKKVGNRWHEVAVTGRTKQPYYTPDGQRRYFRAHYQERTPTGWSAKKSLGPAFEEIRIMGLSASLEGMIVLDEVGSPAGDGVIRYSRLVNGQQEDPKPFGAAINTGTWNAHPFIAPDESYIMWDGERESGHGSSDIWISFRQADGTWGEAINLGDKVNTAAEEGGPRVTPDGKYLFFNRMVPSATGNGELQSDLYWIDAQIIEALRPAPQP